MKVFVAGATGAIGRRLVPLLVDAGHDVVGTTKTRPRSKASGWRAPIQWCSTAGTAKRCGERCSRRSLRW